MGADNSDGQGEGNGNLHNALSVFAELDRHRHLGAGIYILVFFAASALAVLAFFRLIDLFVWDGLTEEVSRFLFAMASVLIIPICMLSFLAALAALDALGFKDVRSAAGQRLARLNLGPDDVHDLRRLLAQRQWRHRRIFESVVADLADHSG